MSIHVAITRCVKPGREAGHVCRCGRIASTFGQKTGTSPFSRQTRGRHRRAIEAIARIPVSFGWQHDGNTRDDTTEDFSDV